MNDRTPSASGLADRPANPTAGDRAAPVDIRTVAHLIPAARAARTAIANSGRSLSRDRLADALRDDGHGVSNARASLLLRILRAEDDDVTQLAPPAAIDANTAEAAA